MLRQPYMQKIILLFHTIVCQFLLIDTGGKGVGERNDKVSHRE